MTGFEKWLLIVYGIIFAVFVALLIAVIIKKRRAGKSEDFEKRDN